MAYDFEEQEQIENLKAWWNRYGGFILTVMVIVSVSVAAWRVWGWYQAREAGRAAVALSVLREAVRANDMPKVRAASKTLEEGHGGSIYAAMGALLAAKAHFDAGDLEQARQSLRWVLDNAPNSEFAPIARLRLAGVLLQDGEAEQALGVLGEVPVPQPYRGAFADRRGDILVELSRPDDARQAYREALDAMGQRVGLSSSVQAKLESLGSGS
ncbi:MAG: tetratricopeptide repeat protein [Burkholderiaceae bacterium]